MGWFPKSFSSLAPTKVELSCCWGFDNNLMGFETIQINLIFLISLGASQKVLLAIQRGCERDAI